MDADLPEAVVDIECRWGSTRFWILECDASLTVADVKLVAAEETCVPVERIKLVGLKVAATNRPAADDTRLADVRTTTRGRDSEQPPVASCIVMGTPDELALAPPTPAQHDDVVDDLTDSSERRAPGVEVMSAFQWRLSRGMVLPPYANLELVWSDDFGDTASYPHDRMPPDAAKWEADTDCNKWVSAATHGELQLYTPLEAGNAYVHQGALQVEARREPTREGLRYTSARLRTRGRGDWQYGRIEVCAKLPPARRGLWPAIWLLPTESAYGPWPNSGEIDIVEHVGFEPGVVYGSVHTAQRNGRKGNHSRRRAHVADAHAAFHVYAAEWEPGEVRLCVDDRCFFRARRPAFTPAAGEGTSWAQWPFDQQRFHLVINIAVGGRWGGRHGVDDAAFPSALQIKYVRVFQLPDAQADVVASDGIAPASG